ncbi:hypothetical protein [Deminuibacter soli]|uniref:Uncharacterized protein n=1 Tax=Deminuibacter soli TaxID=2291815 RepID=A0A3E1ND58_9BACT|nr:hypothetical protein [Deminuibacter soli]RFM25708.1 hypothetical protein DXN05_23650 [Deminuibacter soli]
MDEQLVHTKRYYPLRGTLFFLSMFIFSGLLAVIIPGVAGHSELVRFITTIQFFVVPMLAFVVMKHKFIKSVDLELKPEGFTVTGSGRPSRVLWEKVDSFKIIFSRDGYILILIDDYGKKRQFSFVEHGVRNKAKEVTETSSLYHVCSGIQQYNQHTAKKKLVLLPSLFAAGSVKIFTGVLLSLILIDMGIHMVHPLRIRDEFALFFLTLGSTITLLAFKKNREHACQKLLQLQET